MPGWQTAAGDSLAFEAASLRPSPANGPYAGNVDLDASEYLRYAGGVVTTDGLLINYLIFAYKITDASQYPLLDAQLPKWAHTTRFHVEARSAEGKPTKDQIRLMMQALLVERFKLAVHVEERRLPVYALVLVKTGEPGSRLRPHPDDGMCSAVAKRLAENPSGKADATVCNELVTRDGEQTRLRIGDFSMAMIAGVLGTLGVRMGGLDSRPVVDATGLTGRFDLDITFVRESRGSSVAGSAAEVEAPGATFEEALKTQAGLHLVKKVGAVKVLIVDHVDPPSEN